ncbi:hypothetical protein ACROYT_G018388 [Oculina patagonica]
MFQNLMSMGGVPMATGTGGKSDSCHDNSTPTFLTDGGGVGVVIRSAECYDLLLTDQTDGVISRVSDSFFNPVAFDPRMFADDTNLTLAAKTLTELKLALAPELNSLSCWLKANKLSKTESMIIGSRQRLSVQCDDVEIRIDDQIIERVDHHTKSLGLTIDAHLSWCKHVEEICKKVSSAIGALKRVRPFVSKGTAIQIYNALIMPHFDYCSPVWDYEWLLG